MNSPDNVITVDGEDVVVREDAAKAYRFVHWGVINAAIALATLVIAFVILYWLSARDGTVEGPAATVGGRQ